MNNKLNRMIQTGVTRNQQRLNEISARGYNPTTLESMQIKHKRMLSSLKDNKSKKGPKFKYL